MQGWKSFSTRVHCSALISRPPLKLCGILLVFATFIVKSILPLCTNFLYLFIIITECSQRQNVRRKYLCQNFILQQKYYTQHSYT
jgi:hypothetical protein